MEQLLFMKMLTSRKKLIAGSAVQLLLNYFLKKRVKEVTFTLEQAVKAQRGSRCIVLLFL